MIRPNLVARIENGNVLFADAIVREKSWIKNGLPDINSELIKFQKAPNISKVDPGFSQGLER
jgi:hypothetical protein